jgi:hypothetical protein
MCDASAGVPVSSNLFLVANDEDNWLRLYRTDGFAASPVQRFDLNPYLEVSAKSPETDIEAAALVGNRAYWIGSHGRNRMAKERDNRHRFFATDLTTNSSGTLSVQPVGRCCKNLLDQLIADPRYARFELDLAALRAPKDDEALNIEGLCATPEEHLLIGFRNPIPKGKALVAPLLNPEAVLQGQPARFDAPILLNLRDLGIRDLLCVKDTCWIIAGPPDGGKNFRLYAWKFGAAEDPKRIRIDDFDDYHPEAILHFPQAGPEQFLILSDDGTCLVNGIPCKELSNPAARSFRAFNLSP